MKLTKTEKTYAKKHKILQKTLEKIKSFYTEDFEEEWIRGFEDNPYQLMNKKGFGFKRCDELAMKIGFDMKSPKRVKAYITVAIDESTTGDSIMELHKIISKMEKTLDVERNLVIQTIFEYDGEYILLDDNHKSLTKKNIDSGYLPCYITRRAWYEAEKFLYNWAKKLERQETLKKDYNVIELLLEKNPTLNTAQRNVVENILNKNFNLIIGSSGSGKSYITKVVLDLMERSGLSYTLLAPTGIASFNLSEKTKRDAMTVHRKFFIGEKITTDYVIIDEIGMCGYTHFNMLNQMIPNKANTRVIFIGDKYQLPSISAGDFLASMLNLITNNKIDGNVFELTEVMRSSDDKDITTVCNLFCGKNYFDSSIMSKHLKGVKFLDREPNLFEQIERIIKVNKWCWEDTAIIMPQRKGDFGCDLFNKYIQSKNYSDILFQDKFKLYKKNDILMHIKNNNELNIYNGEMVELIDFYGEEEYLARKLYDGTDIVYNIETLKNETSLGYGFTVHKSQGCTIKNVIFVAIQEFSYMLSRNLMYVGMSRASDDLVVICDKDVVVKSSYKNLTDKRKTFLNLLCGK